MEITKGIIESAQKVVLYGPEGIGKSTFASQFPDPLFIDTEGSTKRLDVKRTPTPSSWSMLKEQLAWVKAHPESCKTLVIDTADWAEKLCARTLCEAKGWESIETPGYGKGFTMLAEEFGKLLNFLNDLIGVGINVMLTAHAQIRQTELPEETGKYEFWTLKLEKKTAPLLKEWADIVLFANYKTLVVQDEKNGSFKAKGGQRRMYTSHRTTWDAKNRHGLPEELELDYKAIAHIISGNPQKTTPTPAAEVSAPPDVSAPTPSKAPDSPPAVPDSPPTSPAQDTSPAKTAKAEKPEPRQETPPSAAEVKGGYKEPVWEELGNIKWTPPPVPEGKEYLKPLYDLMANKGITDMMVRSFVAEKGVMPVGVPLEGYREDVVSGMIVAKWDSFFPALKKYACDQLPF